MRTSRAVMTLALATTLAGCATIINGSTQQITVNSSVEGAEVYLNQTLLGMTPLSTEVKRGQEGTLYVRKEGYQEYRFPVTKKISGAFWINIITGGLYGSTTDYTTGSMYEYEPATFFASLQPSGEESLVQRTRWQRREGLRKFVLLNAQAIVADLAAGRGDYVDALAALLDVQPATRAQALERWRDAYEGSETTLDFADALMEELN